MLWITLDRCLSVYMNVEVYDPSFHVYCTVKINKGSHSVWGTSTKSSATQHIHTGPRIKVGLRAVLNPE